MVRCSAWLGHGLDSAKPTPIKITRITGKLRSGHFTPKEAQSTVLKLSRRTHTEIKLPRLSPDQKPTLQSRAHASALTTQAQRPGPRDATIANRDAMPGSLQRMVRPQSRHTPLKCQINPVRTTETAHAAKNPIRITIRSILVNCLRRRIKMIATHTQ